MHRWLTSFTVAATLLIAAAAYGGQCEFVYVYVCDQLGLNCQWTWVCLN